MWLWQIAFSSISTSLDLYRKDLAANSGFQMHYGIIEKKEGSLPNDPDGYRFRDHFMIPGRPGEA